MPGAITHLSYVSSLRFNLRASIIICIFLNLTWSQIPEKTTAGGRVMRLNLFFPPAYIIMPLRKPIRPTGSDLFRNKMFTNSLCAFIMQSPCYGQVEHTASTWFNDGRTSCTWLTLILEMKYDRYFTQYTKDNIIS